MNAYPDPFLSDAYAYGGGGHIAVTGVDDDDDDDEKLVDESFGSAPAAATASTGEPKPRHNGGDLETVLKSIDRPYYRSPPLGAPPNEYPDYKTRIRALLESELRNSRPPVDVVARAWTRFGAIPMGATIQRLLERDDRKMGDELVSLVRECIRGQDVDRVLAEIKRARVDTCPTLAIMAALEPHRIASASNYPLLGLADSDGTTPPFGEVRDHSGCDPRRRRWYEPGAISGLRSYHARVAAAIRTHDANNTATLKRLTAFLLQRINCDAPPIPPSAWPRVACLPPIQLMAYIPSTAIREGIAPLVAGAQHRAAVMTSVHLRRADLDRLAEKYEEHCLAYTADRVCTGSSVDIAVVLSHLRHVAQWHADSASDPVAYRARVQINQLQAFREPEADPKPPGQLYAELAKAAQDTNVTIDTTGWVERLLAPDPRICNQLHDGLNHWLAKSRAVLAAHRTTIDAPAPKLGPSDMALCARVMSSLAKERGAK